MGDDLVRYFGGLENEGEGMNHENGGEGLRSFFF